ncbi:endo alpha-1,4 polygalactosaminidase [Pseudoduganella sp. S-14]|jgi:hypothetical protein|uniref:endo alpha-1,4 polygalactosaminidase n=1 Tax=Pseudoduganella sp. S-14 TaxID=3404065 RepID=UPI003CE9FE06
MATEPVSLFAQEINPGLVIEVLKKLNAKFRVVGTDDDATQLGYNRFLASEAHRRGMSIALKNDTDQ